MTEEISNFLTEKTSTSSHLEEASPNLSESSGEQEQVRFDPNRSLYELEREYPEIKEFIEQVLKSMAQQMIKELENHGKNMKTIYNT